MIEQIRFAGSFTLPGTSTTLNRLPGDRISSRAD